MSTITLTTEHEVGDKVWYVQKCEKKKYLANEGKVIRIDVKRFEKEDIIDYLLKTRMIGSEEEGHMVVMKAYKTKEECEAVVVKAIILTEQIIELL